MSLFGDKFELFFIGSIFLVEIMLGLGSDSDKTVDVHVCLSTLVECLSLLPCSKTSVSNYTIVKASIFATEGALIHS
jgi:hypothetical protein